MSAASKAMAVLAAFSLAACGSASASRTAAGGAAASASGVSGRVVSGPTCPVERVPPDPRCAPRPLAATLRLRRADGRGRTVIVRSGADGRFRVALAPATYVLSPQPRAGSPLPRPPAPTRVRVRSGRFTAVTVTYDSGIR